MTPNSKAMTYAVVWACFVAVPITLVGIRPLGAADGSSNPYAAWENGPEKSDDYFPIAVWLQAPRNAPKYQALGVNLYVGLWRGPTESQLAELKRHQMPVFCKPPRENTPQTPTKTGENKRFGVVCEPLVTAPRMAYFGP
jgi:hypothetical protein